MRVPAGGVIGQISRASSIAEGFFRTGATGVNSWECDQFGHMNTMFYVRRQTEAGPHFWQLLGLDQPGLIASGRGFAVSEMRMNYVTELYEGDMVETLSVLREVSDRGARVEHRLYNFATGALAAVSDTSLVSFDLQTRKAVAWPDHVRAILQAKLVPASQD
ncbi:MAG TPA: thioesterase [Rhodobiaceae bacterium]|nr:thioesterase [Rhodobiaceae bacterium]